MVTATQTDTIFVPNPDPKSSTPTTADAPSDLAATPPSQKVAPPPSEPITLNINGLLANNLPQVPIEPPQETSKQFISSLAPSPDDIKPVIPVSPLQPSEPVIVSAKDTNTVITSSFTPTNPSAPLEQKYPSSMANTTHDSLNDFPSNQAFVSDTKDSSFTPPTSSTPADEAVVAKQSAPAPVQTPKQTSASIQTTYNPTPISFAPPPSHMPAVQTTVISPPPETPGVVLQTDKTAPFMKKFLIPMIVVLIVVSGFITSLTFSLMSNAKDNKKVSMEFPTLIPRPTTIPLTPEAITPTTAPNPFISPTPSYANPFVELSANYINPFGTYSNPFVTEAQAAENAYSNPFEGLK